MTSSIRLLFLMGMFNFFSFLMPDCSAAKTLDDDIKSHLETIKAYSTGNTDAIKAPKEMAAAMQNTLSELTEGVYKVGADSEGKPSPERKALIERIGSLIAPYNDALVTIGFASTDSLRGNSAFYDLSRQCLSMLDHTKPDDALANAIRAHSLGLSLEADAAYKLLFQHRLLAPSDQAELSRKLFAETDTSNRDRWAVQCGKMNFPEVVPILCEMLSVPFTPEGTTGSTGIFGENHAISNYRRVVEAINVLGPTAAPALPLLRQRLKELDATLPPEQKRIYTAQLQHAIEQIEGKKPLLIPTAINGSGPLLSASQYHGSSRTEGNVSLHEISLSKQETNHRSPSPANGAKATRPSISWLALAGISTVLVATFFMLLRRRR
jgi:hypothetical protein